MNPQEPEQLSGDVQETNFEPDENWQPSPSISSAEAAKAASSPEQQPLLPNSHGSEATASGQGYGSTTAADQPPQPTSKQVQPATAPRPATRALAPDLLRGTLMAFMALDHTVIALRAWPHGTNTGGEEVDDGRPVRAWAAALQYVTRTLGHPCGPGFAFLLGLGVVYFGASRAKLGWGPGRMVRHFFLRALVLTALCVALGLALTSGRVWFMNIVLFALAVDYLLAGLLWLALAPSERALAGLLVRVVPAREEDEVTEPLRGEEGGPEEVVLVQRASDRTIMRAADISWHVHNVVLFAVAVVTIWWNIWLSPNQGRCRDDSKPDPLPQSIIVRIWFYPTTGEHIVSLFPPLAWISFSILGLLYGRILLARSWKPAVIATGNLLAGLGFLVVFMLTRLLQVGNLSVLGDCPNAAAHIAGGRGNSYLSSPQAFFYIIKYPPDVAFWAFAMAANLLLLALFAAVPPRIGKSCGVLLAYGTSALFFYIVHLAVVFPAAMPIVRLFGHRVDFEDPLGEPGTPVMGVDNPWAFFGTWAFTLAVMYPLCKWYSALKRRKGPDSLWRFF